MLEMTLAGDVNDYVLPHFKRFKTTQDIEALVAEYKWPGNVDLPYLAGSCYQEVTVKVKTY